MSYIPPWHNGTDIRKFRLLSGKHLSLQNLALNKVLELQITSTQLFRFLPKQLPFVDECGMILDALHKGQFFRLYRFYDEYEETIRATGVVRNNLRIQQICLRNFLRNTFGLTETLITELNFVVQFKHFKSFPICRLEKTIPCCLENCFYENRVNNGNFFSSIRVKLEFGYEEFRRLIDFPRKKGKVLVRMQYCCRLTTVGLIKCYHFVTIFQKIDCPEKKINLSELTSKTSATIELFHDLKSCATTVLENSPIFVPNL